MKRYDIARNPIDSKWYVIGYAGRNKQGRQQWLPVSNGYNSKEKAISYMRKQYQADKAALAELSGI